MCERLCLCWPLDRGNDATGINSLSSVIPVTPVDDYVVNEEHQRSSLEIRVCREFKGAPLALISSCAALFLEFHPVGTVLLYEADRYMAAHGAITCTVYFAVKDCPTFANRVDNLRH